MGADTIELISGAARLTIARRGAELRQWSVEGEDWLWTPDAAIWADVAPLLFPVVGWTREAQARVGGKTYPLGLHGFARFQDFEVEARRADFVRLVLRDKAETRAQYPYSFEFAVEYRLSGQGLEMALLVRNSGAAPMPYACGFHPGFVFDPAQAGQAVVFDAPERAFVPKIAPGGLFSDEERAISLEGRSLPLTPDLFAQEALCFLNAQSKGLTFQRAGGRVLRVELEDFPHIALWSQNGAPYLCIEAWTGHGDPVGFSGELSAKPSMRLLASGAQARHVMRLGIENQPIL